MIRTMIQSETTPAPAPVKEPAPLPTVPDEPTRQPAPTPVTPPREEPDPETDPVPGFCPLRNASFSWR